MAKANLGKKPDIEVVCYLDIKNPDEPRVILPEEESTLDLNKLPETTFILKSTWARPNYVLTNLIEMNQFAEKYVGGKIQKVYDANVLVQTRIRYLLKSWNLHELDENFKLSFGACKDNPKLKILTDQAMFTLGEIDPPIIVNLQYNKAAEKLYPEEARLLKNLLEELNKK